MNEIQTFDFNGNAVRVVTKDGEPWWVAKDVCEILALGNPRSSIALLEEDEKDVHTIDTPGGVQLMTVVSEAGLYSLILRSRKPEAKAFKRWVTHEVLPTIRKTGGYGLAQWAVPQTFAEALSLAAKLEEERAALAEENAKNAPKVLFAESVASSHTDILIGDLAKLLRQNGVEIGQKRLFAWLRDKGYLIKQHGDSFNMPTQRAMEMGLFRVKETTINIPDGSVRTTKTTKVTGKGQIFFINKFLGRNQRSAA